MFDNIVYKNDYVQVIVEDEQVYIQVFKKGYNIQEFNEIIKGFPRISVTLFVALKSAIDNGLSSLIKIGELKRKIDIIVSSDKLVVHAFLRLTENEYEAANKKQLISEIIDLALNQQVTYGLDLNEIMNNIKPMEKFEIAKGKAPIPGTDAVIKMYEIKKSEPVLYQDGSVNHYELNLINKVNEGEWLGERIEPTEGVSGINVFGEEVIAPKGQQEKLRYDRNTVNARYDEDKGITTLYAKRMGAVVYMNDAISVSNYIEISGDVSFNTGNVDFDGFVDVKNTVDDNFAVRALNDIQILGPMGIGGVELIESTEGSIYIRGGIAGKNKAKITCKGDLYTKFAADCIIECDGVVNIGYYAMNCEIRAKEVILESTSSKIIGGHIEAMVKVEVGELGSKAGVPTRVVITGFNREQIKKDYDIMGETIERLKEKSEVLKTHIAKFKGNELSNEEQFKLEVFENECFEAKSNLSKLMAQRKKYMSYLKAKGEGEVKIKRITYPNVAIKIQDEVLFIREQKSLQTSFYFDGDTIKED